jgi:hypothetical protein
VKVKLRKWYEFYVDLLDAVAVGVVAVVTLKAIYSYNHSVDSKVRPLNVALRTTETGTRQVLVELSNGQTFLWDVNGL